MKRLIATLLGVMLALVGLASTAQATGGGHDPVTVCHMPGTPAEQELTFDKAALWQAHIRHGDTLGPCTPKPTEEPCPTPTVTPPPVEPSTTPEPTSEPTSEPEPSASPTDSPTASPTASPDPTEPSASPDPTPTNVPEPSTSADPEPVTNPVVTPAATVNIPSGASAPAPRVTSTSPTELAATGVEDLWYALAGLLLIGGGAALLRLRRVSRT